jgi:hypothetical protein
MSWGAEECKEAAPKIWKWRKYNSFPSYVFLCQLVEIESNIWLDPHGFEYSKLITKHLFKWDIVLHPVQGSGL